MIKISVLNVREKDSIRGRTISPSDSQLVTTRPLGDPWDGFSLDGLYYPNLPFMMVSY